MIIGKGMVITPATENTPVKLTIIDYESSGFFPPNGRLSETRWSLIDIHQHQDISQLLVAIFNSLLSESFDYHNMDAIKKYVNLAGFRLKQHKSHGYENWTPPFNLSSINDHEQLPHYLPDPNNLYIARSLVPFLTVMGTMHDRDLHRLRQVNEYLKYFKIYYQEN
jgi:hypothetical protein